MLKRTGSEESTGKREMNGAGRMVPTRRRLYT